jgi:hypothetical protein
MKSTGKKKDATVDSNQNLKEEYKVMAYYPTVPHEIYDTYNIPKFPTRIAFETDFIN